MALPISSPSSSSPAAIVEGIKQGNALEIQLVKQMRDGLNMIADGMQKECHDRSDACDELSERLEAMGGVITANHKGKMRELIKDGTDVCEKLKRQALHSYVLGCRESGEDFQAAKDKRTVRGARLDARVQSTRKLSAIFEHLRNSAPEDESVLGKWKDSYAVMETAHLLLEEEIKECGEEVTSPLTRCMEETERGKKTYTGFHCIADEFGKVLAEMSLVLGSDYTQE